MSAWSILVQRGLAEVLYARHDDIVADLEFNTVPLAFSKPPTHLWAIPDNVFGIFVVSPEESIDIQSANLGLGQAREHSVPIVVHIAMPAMNDSGDTYLYERCDMLIEILAMRVTTILLQTTKTTYGGYTLGVTGGNCTIRDSSEYFDAETYGQEMVVFQRTIQCTARIGVVQPNIFDPAVVAALLQTA